MKTCIYCGLSKNDDQFDTDEHIIPQFLGGACAPDRFRTNDVCTKCNHNLGLFVDGSFAKSFFVANWLTFAGLGAYSPASNVGPPLMCMGISNLEMPGIKDDEVCEGWTGPTGEPVFLVRKKSDRFYWYAGGDPIHAKRHESRAYFMFSKQSEQNIKRALLAFRDAFRGKRVKKVCGTDVTGIDLKDYGFSEPDALDLERIEVIRKVTSDTPVRQTSIQMNVDFDTRFVCKLALGIAATLFGDEFLDSSYCGELRKGIWPRDGESMPEIRGAKPLTQNPQINEALRQFIGFENAVTLIITQVPDGVTLTLTLGKNMTWTILMTPRDVIGHDVFRDQGNGRVLILFPGLHECFEISLVDFIRHKSGSGLINALSEAEAQAIQGKPKVKNNDTSTEDETSG